MEAVRALLGTRYHPDEYPEQGCWWLSRLLELPTWQRLVLRAGQLPPALATLLDGSESIPDATSERAYPRLTRLRSVLPVKPPSAAVSYSRNMNLPSWPDLDVVERDVLHFRLAADVYSPLFEAVHMCRQWTDSRLIQTLAHVLRYPADRIATALAVGSPLIDQRLLQRHAGLVAEFSVRLAVGTQLPHRGIAQRSNHGI